MSISDAAGTNKPPTASFTYIQDIDIFTFNASGSFDLDGSITEYTWDFGDGTTETGVSTKHQFSKGSWAVTLTATDNQGGLGLLQQSVTYGESFSLAINFQPKAATVPAGYLADSGLPLDVSRGYGWLVASFKDILDRNDATGPDQTYDTLINVYPDSVWEEAVPNGTYTVKVLVGDPTYPKAINSIQIEGQPLIDRQATSLDIKFIEASEIVTVADGRLTMSFIGSNLFSKLCRVHITKID